MSEEIGTAAGPGRSRVGVAVRLALALACLALVAWVAATRWDVLLAGHPAYPLALAAVAVVGLALVARAVRPPQRRTALRTAGGIVGAVVLVAVLAALAWLRPFPAEPVAVAAAAPSATVDVTSTPTRWELRPRAGATGAGVVFFPGARVDPRAYLALLRPLAEQGHLVVVVKPPLDFALLSTGAAASAFDAHPEVRSWVLAGHSLGGVAAASAAASGDPRAAGLVLWASYPAGDITGVPFPVLSITGERDGLTTPADVEATRARLPAGTPVVVVPGAVHAFFGDYGPQPGDGEATTSRSEAQQRIVEETAAFVAAAG